MSSLESLFDALLNRKPIPLETGLTIKHDPLLYRIPYDDLKKAVTYVSVKTDSAEDNISTAMKWREVAHQIGRTRTGKKEDLELFFQIKDNIAMIAEDIEAHTPVSNIVVRRAPFGFLTAHMPLLQETLKFYEKDDNAPWQDKGKIAYLLPRNDTQRAFFTATREGAGKSPEEFMHDRLTGLRHFAQSMKAFFEQHPQIAEDWKQTQIDAQIKKLADQEAQKDSIKSDLGLS